MVACLIVSVLAGATLSSNVAVAPPDVMGAGAGESETHVEALRRGAAELEKLRTLRIKTLG